MNIDDICFFDTETRAEDHATGTDGNVKTAGTYRYAQNAFVIVSTFAIGREPVFEVSLDEGFDGDWLTWARMPDALKRHHDRVMAGKAYYAAFNAGFDRAVWNSGTADFPRMEPEHILDIMAQAIASNLPPSLEGASRAVGSHGKQRDGKSLINLFCSANGGTPQSHPEEWARFKSYGLQDTDELRAVFERTRALPLEEWQEYWASERINERGIMVDVEFAAKAARGADRDQARTNGLLYQLTDGAIKTVNQHQKMADWVWDMLEYSEARDILVKEINEELSDDEEDTMEVVGLSLERARVSRLIAFFEDLRQRDGGLSNSDATLLRVLELREFGASAAPKKFKKMLEQHDDGALKGQYVFNGAAQTGRFCVAADTVVDTPEGRRYIVDLVPGDSVITHLNRPRSVTALVYKGQERMFRLHGPNASVDATGKHRVLTAEGWKRIDELFKETPARPGDAVTGALYVPITAPSNTRHRGRLRCHNAHSRRYLAGLHAGCGATSLAWGLSLAVENGVEEPDVRCAESGGARHAHRTRGGVERGGVHIRAPHLGGEKLGYRSASAEVGSTPHRRGQDEQLAGQSSHSNEIRSPETSQKEAWSLVCLGERDVWDISVEEDESYCAGGLVHHNSAKGVQVHNMTRSTLGSDEETAIEMINELET